MHAHPATDAAQLVHSRGEFHAEGVELAVRQAIFAGHAQGFINGVDKSGMGYCIGNAQFADTSQHPARAGAAVAYVGFAMLVVADRVHQSCFCRNLEGIQSFLQRQGANVCITIKCAWLLVEHHAYFKGVIAWVTDQGFLLATDAVDHTPCFRIPDDIRCAFIRTDFHIDLNTLANRDHTVHGWLNIQ